MPANFSGYVDPETIIKQQKKRIAELKAELDECRKINIELRETLRHYTINLGYPFKE